MALVGELKGSNLAPNSFGKRALVGGGAALVCKAMGVGIDFSWRSILFLASMAAVDVQLMCS